MKSKAIKIISILLALAMTLSLAACGGSGDDKTDTADKGGAVNSNSQGWKEIKAKIPADASGKSIEVFTWNDLSDVTGAPAVVENFTKETGIKIEWNKSGGTMDDYFTKVVARVASNDAPDIVRLRGTDLGVLQVLQPLDSFDFDFKSADWDSRIMDIYTFGGKTYATNMRNTLLQQPRCLIYNKKLISKYDLEDPYTLWKNGQWTWAKFEEICEIYADEAGDNATAWTSYRWADAADVYGSALIKREGDKFVANTDDGNLLKGWQTMTTLVEKGITNNIRFDRNNFENGKVLFFTESPIGVRRTHYYFQSLKSTGSVAIVPLPTVEGGTDAVIWSEVEAYGIPEGAPNGNLSPYFLRYYLDGDNYDKKTFFADPTILDVYESLMKADKIFVNYDTELITEDVGIGGIHLNARLVNAKPAQIKARIDENANIVKAAVDNANGMITKLD